MPFEQWMGVITLSTLGGKREADYNGRIEEFNISDKMWTIIQLFKELGLFNIGVKIFRGKASHIDL